jgi:predicted transcriptional regulator
MPRLRLSNEEKEIRAFSNWVRGELVYRNLRQQDLADALEISKAAVCQKLKTKMAWSLSDVAKVCEFFGEPYKIGEHYERR